MSLFDYLLYYNDILSVMTRKTSKKAGQPVYQLFHSSILPAIPISASQSANQLTH